jgi:spore coat protein A
LLLAPAERADILVNFSDKPAGQKIILQNSALINPSQAESQTLGQMLQFSVIDEVGFSPKQLPSNLNPTLAGDFPSLPTPSKERMLTLTQVTGPNGPLEILLDGQKWASPITENPEVGTTEDWVIVNPTQDAHPIHVHLIQFQIVKRQAFNATAYMTEWTTLNGQPPLNHTTINVDSLDSYLIGSPFSPPSYEQGWKDTIVAFPNEVTVIRIRFTQQDGSDFPFDTIAGPGYVWHCHLVEHEDNEMMRPYIIIQTAEQFPPWLLITIVIIVAVTAFIFGFLGVRYLRRSDKKSQLR